MKLPYFQSPFVSPTSPPRSVRTRWLLAFGGGALALLLYSFCLAPTVTYGGDCGELIAASYRLGIAHPTGYPFYCLLGKLFATLVPIGEIGWRYNLLSALLGALAVAFMIATSHRLLSEDDRQTNAQNALETDSDATIATPKYFEAAIWPSLGAGLLLAGFTYFGSQALIAEVYALNGCFLALLLYLGVSWHQSGDWRAAYALVFVFGLSLTAHLSGVFLGPALFCFVAWQHRARFGKRSQALRRATILVALFLAGFSLTLYLPVRAALWPAPPLPGPTQTWQWWPLDWGHPVDWAHWKAHISGAQYKRLLFSPHKVLWMGQEHVISWFVQPLSDWPRKILWLLRLISLQYLWCSPLLAAGAWRAWRHNRALGFGLFLSWALNIGIQINYDVNDVVNFFFPAYLAMALWMGFGLHWLWHRAEKFSSKLEARGLSRWAWRMRTILPLLLIGTIVLQWSIFARVASYRGQSGARDRSIERADAVEKLARRSGQTPQVFLYSNDALWSFWYVQYVLGRAPHAVTPWGSLGNAALRRVGLATLAPQIQRAGPLVVAQWDAALDARFPLDALTPSGNLCVASQRVLPLCAAPITASDTPKYFDATARAAGTILRARFVRLSQNRDGLHQIDAEDLPNFDVKEKQALPLEGITTLKREDMASFEIDFRCPAPKIISKVLWDASHHAPFIDEAQNAVQIGWIEVLIASRGALKLPIAPAQGNLRGATDDLPLIRIGDAPLKVWKQRRRLVVSGDAKIGAHLRQKLVLQLEADATDGLHSVWTRMVTRPNDTKVAWQRTDWVLLTHQ